MNLLDEALSLIYPNVCGFCEKIEKTALCKECEEKIMPHLVYGINNIDNKYFEKHIYIMHYKGELRDNILLYKFKDKSYMYKTFTRIILKNEKICKILTSYDIIISVPIHKKRKNERGYNQSELIAREIAANIEKIKYVKVLKKVKDNVMQSSLKKTEREINVKNAYEVLNKEIICNKRIVLFDDIYTTGSTANECSKVLKENGAREILILSLAK